MMVVNYIAIACFLFVSVNAQMCSLFCGPGQKCEYVGSQPMCVPYQGGIIPGGGISGWNRGYGGRGRHVQGGSGWLDPFMGGGGTGMVGMGMGGVGPGMGMAGMSMGGVGTGMVGMGGVGTGMGMAGMGMGGVGTGIGVLPPVVPPVLPPVGGGNVGVVNPGGVGPAVVDDRSRSMGLNLNVQNTNINQHTHSGSGGTQVNKPGVIPVPVPVPVHGG